MRVAAVRKMRKMLGFKRFFLCVCNTCCATDGCVCVGVMHMRGGWHRPYGALEGKLRVVCGGQVERKRFVGIIQAAMAAGCRAVVDVCAFDKDAVRDVVIGIGSAPAHYILISSDSVYMCCLPPAPPGDTAGPGAGGGVREEAAVRPAAAAERARLQARDPYQYAYGSGKLAAEECLAAVRGRTGFRYTSLRLADVCGPRDNIGAFLRLQALVSTGMPVPVAPPPPPRGGQGQTARGMRARRISVVCVDDVAAAVVAALRAGARVHGESINVAGPEASFEGFVRAVAAAVDASCRETPGAGRVQTRVTFAEHLAALGFPSVDVGPVDTAKARRLLGPFGWRASALEDWILPTVEWNRDGRNAAYTLAFVRRNAAGAP